MDATELIDALIDREGGYVNHPADRGGPTKYGITEAVARAYGYAGAMAQLPRDEAAAIYRRLYWLRPRFDQVARRSPALAAELFDTGANMGPAVAATFLQRALTALNRNGKDYPDLVPTAGSARRRSPRSTPSSKSVARRPWLARMGATNKKQPARPFCCERSRRCRANATCASLSAARPTRPSSTGGSRTASVSLSSQQKCRCP
jgi:hypothetical protein